MIYLNDLCKQALANAEQREENGGNISTDTRRMLKHCATEVVEATEAYTVWKTAAEYREEDFSGVCANDDRKCFVSELADIICCALIIAGKEDINIEQAVLDCMEKNRKRAERQGDKL